MKISKLALAPIALGFGQLLFVASASGQETMSAGEYLARAANCVACHSVPGGEPFAGGLPMAVPDIGVIYSTNITPDPETGIGSYTLEDFTAAMRDGVAKDGHNLYPAMPYTSYARTSDADMKAMYDYFMKEVKPVKLPNKPAETKGWKSARWLLSVFNLLYHDDDAYEADAKQSAEWNRGAYLVEGLGHCGACHTPRGFISHETGLASSDDDFLAGALLDHWSAPSLNGDVNAGLGRWSVDDIAEFLKKGKNKFGTAFGTMVEVINSSTAYMTDADLKAMAVYLKTLPANEEEGAKPYQYDESTHQQLTKFDFSKRGAQPYYEFCATCHGYDGKGAGDRMMPALAGNPVVLDSRPESLVNLTINGSLRVVRHGNDVETFDMPPFYILMSDQQVADVVSFIRTAWGNSGKEVTVEHVAKLRANTKPVAADDVILLRMK